MPSSLQLKHSQRVLPAVLAISIVVMAACGSPDSVRATSHSSVTQAIIGGTPAAITDFPWQVSLWSSGGVSFGCGGVIVAEQWVLTAQHCVEGAIGRVPGLPPRRIVAGVSKLSQSSAGQSRDVVDFIHYPGYGGLENRDLTLLKLSSPLDLSAPGVKAIPIATTADAASGLIATGTRGIATGWGSTIVGTYTSTDELQQVGLTVNYVAGGVINLLDAGKSACHGDSGGPFVVRDGSGTWKLAGIASAASSGDCSGASLYVDLSTPEHQMWVSRSINWRGGLILSDSNPNLAINAFGGAVHGAPLKLVGDCTPENPDCTWTYRNGMLLSDSNRGLAISAYGGAQMGTRLRLVNNCNKDMPDCTWTYRLGMFFSDTNPALAINAYGGARHQADLVLVDNCNAAIGDCTWTYRNVTILSDYNANWAMEPIVWDQNRSFILNQENRTTWDTRWTLHRGLILSQVKTDLAIAKYDTTMQTEALLAVLSNSCTQSNPLCTFTFRKGLILNDKAGWPGAYHAMYDNTKRQGGVIIMNTNCSSTQADCTWSVTR